ncbi:MAG: glycosyltransferase family 4 protein [Alphaproteobacteria bacterium]|nr:glycosyltransferase family 4 protein [Alphaproteobacteria bacterium]MBQ6855018.1 glycosyltransferase family 4 protein [Alphaproteobacteria bacterium]MBQ8557419.1 glycosyltransferase family 4 protein [Alphaproteobacteria bacterium]
MKTKRSIVQVLPALNQGGVERGTIEIAEALQKVGIRNYVVSSGGKMVEELKRIGVEHITLPVKTKNPLKMWLNSYRLAKIFKEKEVGLVHVRSRAPAWSVKWACRRMRIPFVATFHGLYGMKPESLKKPYNRVMTQGKLVIAVSSFIHQHLMKEYNIADQHIRLIPRGADINKFDMGKVTKAQLEDFVKEYGIPTDKPIITLAGRLSRIKGHSVVLDAIKQMKNQNVTVLFVGGNPKGDYEQELKEKIAGLPKETTLKMFAVSGDKMPLVYALTDIYVQPTLVPESFGRSIAEAQAMGRIVIAANHGGACELIVNGRTGFLTPVGDSQKMAAMLDTVLALSDEEKNEIGQKATESVRTNFSIQKMCDRTVAVYKEILGNELDYK